MTMTSASSQYFADNARAWDELRSGYFGVELRDVAIRRAYLRPEMTVADVGSGTGFMAAALAPLVSRVIALDGSPEMLDVARENLKALSNVEYKPAEGTSLPLPDASVDAVFANMFLHHLPNPLPALREMARILRPGGRVIITDLDQHPYEWLKTEMADEWAGFDRSQILAWLEEAGLVNRLIDRTGESCCAESSRPDLTDEHGRNARISVFVAVGTKRVSGAREAVQEHYGQHAAQGTCCGGGSSSHASSSCCGGEPASSLAPSSCCGASDAEVTLDLSALPSSNYAASELQSAPAESAAMTLGCGNPTALAGLQPGETVLDIGSGAGLDSFLSARRVGPTGRVIGVDMTEGMLERARRSAEKAGLTNVEFRHGHAEKLPVEDATVDVVLSNCVINLTEDKGQVFREAFRVLRPGGRLEISDVVADGSLSAEMRANPQAWGDCIFGALPEQEYLDMIAQAGFEAVSVRQRASYGETSGTRLWSATVTATRPDGEGSRGCSCSCS